VPDVLVLMRITGGTDLISFTYPKVVKRTQAAEHLKRLLAETGWAASDISITDDSVQEAGETPMTSVEFAAAGAVRLDIGGLPLEPIIKAFKDLKTMQVVYAVPASFAFRGLSEYENEYVKIALRRGTTTYMYSITIKDPDFETLGLPFLQPEVAEAADDTGHGGSSPTILAVTLVVVLALSAAALVYLVTSRIAGPSSRNGS